VKFFHPLHLYCVTTLPSKTNTTANTGVKCLHFSRNVMVSVGVTRMGKTRVVFIDPEAKVNSSYYCNIVLEEGLLSDIRAICRHYGWTLQQDGTPAHIAWTTSTSLNLARGLQIALILIPWITLFGYSFSNESTTNNNSRRWKNWSERQSPSGKNSHSVSLITVSINGVDVLKLLSRMAADTSSIATCLEQPHIILILSRDKFSQ